MRPSRDPAVSRRIAVRALALAIALIAMLAQSAGYTRPECLDQSSSGEFSFLEIDGVGPPSTVDEIPKARFASDADDDADDDDPDDECVPAHAFLRTLTAQATLSFAERVTTEIGPPRPLELLLVAPKNSPPIA